MTRWQDALNQHPVFATIEKIKAISNVETDDSNLATELLRLRDVIARVENVLNNISPSLLPINRIDNIQKSLTAALPHLDIFRSEGTLGSIRSCNDQLGPAIVEVGILGSLSDIVSEEKADLAKKSLEIIESYLHRIDERANEFAQNCDKLEERFSGLFDSTNKISEAASADISKLRDNFDNDLEKRKLEFEVGISNQLSEVSNSAVSAKNDIELKLNELSRLFNLATDKSMTGAYELVANREALYGILWRSATVVFIVSTAIWLIYVFLNNSETLLLDRLRSTLGEFPQVNSPIDPWVQYLRSATVAAVLVFGATYCAQQATRHRNMEIRVKWFALQMSAIDPFLNTLPEDDRIDVKKRLSQSLFNANTRDEDTDIVSHTSLKTIMESIVDIVKSLRK